MGSEGAALLSLPLRLGRPFFALSLLGLVGPLPPARADTLVTPLDAAKKARLELEKTLVTDFDGDGAPDTVGVCRGDRGLALCVFGYEDKDRRRAKLEARLPWAGGTRLKSLEAQDLLPGLAGMEVLLEVYDETPDEKVKRIRIYAGHPQPREVFTSVIFWPKDENKRPEWERPEVVKYGDARPGWYFEDVDGDGAQEIIVRRQAQLLRVPREPEPAKLLTGVREAIFAYTGGATGRFTERREGRFRDFLPALDVTEVRGSAVWLPQKLLEDLQAEALAKAVYEATDGKPVENEVKVDFSPFFAKVADKDLSTAWIEDDAEGDGKGEWVELTLPEAKPIHMVRVVGGCVGSKREFRQHNVPLRYELRFDSGERTLVDLEDKERPMRPAVAVLELPLKDKRWAKQTLVFLDGKVRSKTVRITLEKAKRQGRANRTCISEISVH